MQSDLLSKLGLSNTSFTNKEFEDVYPELLNLASKLSYRWDPTVSNESDPGVVLIKELALVLDKINYSSDKNALETMPLSVTQQRTARQLFQILGYYPKWYLSSTVDVDFAWKPEEGEYDEQNPTTIYLPAFTQIKDDSGDYVYATTDNIPLLSDGTIETTTAIQGIIKSLTINNTTDITYELLDSNRRIYFPDYNVAQNGVFVVNIDSEDSVHQRHYWEQKDNLGSEEIGNTYYSFNVDIASNRCYLEFPIDISDLIRDGLHIYYAISSGQDGLVSINQLNQLYGSSVTCQIKETDQQQEQQTVSLTTDTVSIRNTSLTFTGKNPESIDSMYNNYNHIKGTFDTLVTLKDYNNAVFNTEKVSNAVVTDRTNDVQRSYRVMSQTVDGKENVVYTQEKEGDITLISPFGLKVYALQYNDLTSTKSESVNKSAYDNTFEMYTDLDVEDPLNIDSSLLQLVNLLNNDKCVQHDFFNIESKKICLIKNVAEINLTIFPTINLTQLQKESLISEIKKTIYKKYNARQVEFGKEINYDDLFTNLITSSQYIKNISLGQVQYYTYALYHSEAEQLNGILLKDAWRQVCISDEIDYILGGPAVQDVDSYGNPTGTFNSMTVYGQQDKTIKDRFKNYHPYILAQDNNVYYLDSDQNIVLYSTKRQEFRTEVLAKNIIAGITPMYIPQDENFKLQVDEYNEEYLVKDIDITTNMVFDFTEDPEPTYDLHPNEVVQLVRGQLIDKISYGAYIKYDYKGVEIPANSVHKLGADEELVIYYKTEDSETAPYTRVIYKPELGEDDILIQPNFNLTQTNATITLLSIATVTPPNVGTCSANQSIAIKEKNIVELNSKSKIYVIGNQFKDEEENKEKYKITFTKEGDSYVRELTGEEQFIYSTNELTYLNILGSGTRIEIKSSLIQGDTYVIENDVISSRDIALFGSQALKEVWQSIPGSITVIGQEFINVLGTDAEDSYVKLSPKFQMNVPVKVILDREGLRYETDGQTGTNVNSISGLIETTSLETGNVSYTNLSTNDFQDNWFDDFVCEEYGATEFTPINKQITLTPIERPSVTLEDVAFPGGEITSVSGDVTSTWTETINNVEYTYRYVINGSDLYIMRCLTSEVELDNWDVSKVNGFIVNSQQTSVSQTSYDSGVYTYTSSEPIDVGKSVIAYDPDATLANQIVTNMPIWTNTEDSAQTSFPSTSNLSDKTVVICDYYEIFYGAYYNYDTRRQNYQKLLRLDMDPSDPQSYISNEDPNNGVIVFEVNNVADQYNETYYYTPLYQTKNLYEYSSSNDFATSYNYWQFQDINGNNKLIKNGTDSGSLQSILLKDTVQLPSAWNWPPSCEITITVFNDWLEQISPQLFNIVYKNSGEEEQTVQFNSDQDIEWKIRGLAQLNFINGKYAQLFENQTIDFSGKTIQETSDFEEQQVVAANYYSQGVKNIYLYSSYDMNIEGFGRVSTEFVDSDNVKSYPLILFTYDYYDYEDNENYLKDSGNSKVIKIEKATSLTFNFDVKNSGEYSFEIRNYQNLSKFEVSGQVQLLQYSEQGIPSAYDIKEKGTYQFIVSVEEQNSTFSLDMTIQSSSDDPVKVEIYPLTQINTSKGIYSFDTQLREDVITRLKSLSRINGKDAFNYLYVIDQSKAINNPLVSTSFNNLNHFYNPFTICKIVEYDILGQDNIFINN